MPKIKTQFADQDILCCYFDAKSRTCVVRLRNGESFRRTLSGKFVCFAKKKDGVTLEVWTDRVIAIYNDLPEYAKDVKTIPSITTMQRWLDNGVGRTIDGHKIELDGVASNGAPSWVLALGLI